MNWEKKKERGKERKESEQSVVVLQLVNKNHIIIFLNMKLNVS